MSDLPALEVFARLRRLLNNQGILADPWASTGPLAANIAAIAACLAASRRGGGVRHHRAVARRCARRNRAMVEALPIKLRDGATPAPSPIVREEQFQRGDTLAGFLSAPGHRRRGRRAASRACARCGTRAGHASCAPKSAPTASPPSLSFLTGRDTLVRIAPRRGLSRGRGAARARDARRDEVQRDPQLALRRDRRRGHSRRRRHAARRHFRRRHRLPSRPAQGRPLHRRLRAAPPRRRARCAPAACSPRNSSTRARPSARCTSATGYYTPDGKNLRKAFLRSPLEFSRVSSGFGMRMHPIRGRLAQAPGHRLRRARPARACARSATAWSNTPA